MKIRIGHQLISVTGTIPILSSTLIMIAFTLYHSWKFVPLFYIGLLGMLLCWIVMPVEKLLQLAFLLAPNIMAIKLSHDSSALYGYFFILIFLKYAFLHQKVRIKIPFLLFLVSLFVTAITYSEYTLILTTIRCFLFFVAIYTIFNENWSKDLTYRASLIRSYICGVALCVLCGFVHYILAQRNIFSGYFSGINNGRNFFSSLLSCGIAATLVYISRSKQSNTSYKVAIVLMLFAGILSNSRTFLASLCFILLLIVSMLSKRKMRHTVLQFGLIIIASFLLFGDSILPSLEKVLNRFTQDDVSGGNGRFAAWGYFIKKATSSPWRFLFGNGLALKYVNLGEVDVVEHNSIVELFSTSGLIGTIITCFCFFHVYRVAVISRANFRITDFVPLLCSMTCYFMLSAMFSDIFNFSLLISLLVADYNCRMRAGKPNT